MKRNVLIAVALLVIVAAGVAVLAVSGKRAEWTTSSPQALAEFQLGLEAREKVYHDEARQHFAKAVALDPGFLIAKYFLAASSDMPSTDPKTDALMQELAHADTARLTDRERFLIRYAVASHGHDTAARDKVLAEYAAKHPDDPYVLERQADLATSRQEWPEAHRLLARLVEVAPNRVVAYNELGYLEMGQGRFAEAQKMFETYRYIAPDQANPHDSLGELFILLGRYPEAKKELDDALTIKPDFCASWDHLVRLDLMAGRVEDARQAAARAAAAGACGATLAKSEPCLIAVWANLLASDWDGLWKAQQASCSGVDLSQDPLQVWVALRTGRSDVADGVEKTAHDLLAKAQSSGAERAYAEAFVAHVEGARLLGDGKAAQAAERFRFADRALSYRQLELGVAKLFNKVALAQALNAAGAHEEAAAVLADARAVNAGLVDTILAMMGWRNAA